MRVIGAAHKALGLCCRGRRMLDAHTGREDAMGLVGHFNHIHKLPRTDQAHTDRKGTRDSYVSVLCKIIRRRKIDQQVDRPVSELTAIRKL